MTENTRPKPVPPSERKSPNSGGKGRGDGANSKAGGDSPKRRRGRRRGSHAKKRGSQQQRRRGSNRRGRGTSARKRQQRPVDSSLETRNETSAGGLVVSGMAEAVDRHDKVDLSKIYVALIGRLDRRGRLLWSMPKGHVEEGEEQWRTAEREVWEETGITGEAFNTLGVIDYWFISEGVRIHKTVHHNLLRYVDGVFNDEDPEVTEVAWVPMNQLIERLAYADERKLARIAVNRMPDLARKEAAAGRLTPR
ncbi:MULTISPECIES: NUDIX hydrolase [Corynebacterium]|uniref:NUDIX hydrolase n=2 Tax=Corynebacterium TaxID=1716 RepID=A0ABD4TRK5_9CORY|nr:MULTISPECIES: NUDIX hydrolase [Corynebacterium]MCO6395093.1 NUDIX hydrolase [Corynebacterium lipophilum]MCQ4612668.1 NUDIX hydrolase [Corynebacterium sp. CCUG 51687]MCQ4614952.1 NUDIX hydrolase [Corynebacterium pseudogenitalium]MCZ2116877.1 NUDIX hydrolase [Corynebacterium lipophilum]